METFKDISIILSVSVGLVAAMGAAFSLVICLILSNSGEFTMATIRQILNSI